MDTLLESQKEIINKGAVVLVLVLHPMSERQAFYHVYLVVGEREHEELIAFHYAVLSARLVGLTPAYGTDVRAG